MRRLARRRFDWFLLALVLALSGVRRPHGRQRPVGQRHLRLLAVAAGGLPGHRARPALPDRGGRLPPAGQLRLSALRHLPGVPGGHRRDRDGGRRRAALADAGRVLPAAIGADQDRRDPGAGALPGQARGAHGQLPHPARRAAAAGAGRGPDLPAAQPGHGALRRRHRRRDAGDGRAAPAPRGGAGRWSRSVARSWPGNLCSRTT